MATNTLYNIVSWNPDVPGYTVHVSVYGFREAKQIRDQLRDEMPDRIVRMVRA